MTLLAKNLCSRCASQLDIDLTITPAVKEELVKKHTDLKMGARPLKRAIQSQIEDALSEEILSGKVKPGDRVSASLKDKKIVFVVKEKEINKDKEIGRQGDKEIEKDKDKEKIEEKIKDKE